MQGAALQQRVKQGLAPPRTIAAVLRASNNKTHTSAPALAFAAGKNRVEEETGYLAEGCGEEQRCRPRPSCVQEVARSGDAQHAGQCTSCYRPPRENAEKAKDSESSATRTSVGGVAAAPSGGVSIPHTIMHAAGPTNAMPCMILRTAVSFTPRSTMPSASGPTSGIIRVIAMYGIRVRKLLLSTSSPSASSK
eukprot:356968-Chlamydomonas_euryale.AAC.32